MLKAEHLSTAQNIATRLSAIRNLRTIATKGVRSAGVRFDDNANTWVDLPKDQQATMVRLILAGLDTEEAALRRRAAQIGLSL